jgi:hypothetical protein
LDKLTRPYDIPTYTSCKHMKFHEYLKVIDNGYRFSKHKEDSGFYVGYDLAEEKAYVYFHTR